MFVLLGAAMGTLGGLFGIGGGLVAIPALGVLFGLDQQLAQGTALLMVLPNVLLALWRYNQRNRILLRNALMLIIPSFFFAWLTSLLAVRVDPQGMRLGFIGFLVVLTVFNVAQMYWRSKQAGTGLRHEKWLWVLGVGSGDAGGRARAGAVAGRAEHRDHAGHLCTARSRQLVDGHPVGDRRSGQHQLGRQAGAFAAGAHPAPDVLRVSGAVCGDSRA